MISNEYFYEDCGKEITINLTKNLGKEMHELMETLEKLLTEKGNYRWE